jgi:phosphatidylglycerol:prolipoprotein diacylglycerol transferase
MQVRRSAAKIMLPNLYIPELKIIGPVTVKPFGVLVALSILIGYWLAIQRAKRTGLDMQIFADCLFWALAGGFLGAHLFWAFFYNPQMIKDNPLVLLKIWEGISSFGGFFGGSLGVYFFFRRKNVDVIRYFEAIAFGFVPAWAIARLGCTIVFDHPGRPTDFILGMADGTGIVRHNLGFYEMLWTVVIVSVLYGLRNYRPFEGFQIVLVFFMYAPVRIFLDSLRVDDRTWGGFTPGQYFSVLLLALGVWLMVRGMRNARGQRSEFSGQ